MNVSDFVSTAHSEGDNVIGNKRYFRLGATAAQANITVRILEGYPFLGAKCTTIALDSCLSIVLTRLHAFWMGLLVLALLLISFRLCFLPVFFVLGEQSIPVLSVVLALICLSGFVLDRIANKLLLDGSIDFLLLFLIANLFFLFDLVNVLCSVLLVVGSYRILVKSLSVLRLTGQDVGLVFFVTLFLLPKDFLFVCSIPTSIAFTAIGEESIFC